jgi:hypothetical protein
MLNWLRGLFDRTPVLLTIVRRYQDAQGHNVGELYRSGICIGCSLDSFSLYPGELDAARLDLAHDFLAPMGIDTLRVGSMVPADNDAVCRTISHIPRKNIRLSFQNRFVEHVLYAQVNV